MCKLIQVIFICFLGQFVPVQTEIRKYSSKGGFRVESFKNLPKKVTQILMKAANFSVARNTWRTYSTAKNHIKKAEKWSGIKMEIPFTLDMTLTYIAYLRGKPKTCKADTIEKYFSGLRMAHLEEGFNPVCLRVNIVKQVLNGAAQMDVAREKLENKPERLAVTVPVLRLLKQAIKCKNEWPQSKKRLVWAVSTLAFAGSFRIHELLSRDSESYDQTQTLLGRDIKEEKTEIDGEEVGIIIIHLKSPKEQKLAKGVNVDIFSLCTEKCSAPSLLTRNGTKYLL